MGYQLSRQEFNLVLKDWAIDHRIYAPKSYADEGRFSDTDCVRYGEVKAIEDIVFDQKSEYSFKEVLLPNAQTLFYFTEDTVKESTGPEEGIIIFLRSCDLHAVKRLDQIYLENGAEDYYYKRIREKVKFILIGCSHSYDNCFCVGMGSNQSDDYDLCINVREEHVEVDCKNASMQPALAAHAGTEKAVTVDFVNENETKINIPKSLSIDVASSELWRQYDQRCINCGRCNFVCPTCTCFTMQDLYYTENGNAGERRRVCASCMVDGFTDVAGGGSYRQKNGDRMRFKVLHKVLDYRQRTGENMCVGCGRCDDICPEYISFSACVNKLEDAMKEVGEK